MKTSKVLQDALKLFGRGGKNWVNHTPQDEKQNCSVSAISLITYYEFDERIQRKALEFLKVAAKIRKLKGVLLSSAIISWNDKATWTKIKTAFNEAIKLAKAKGD